MFIQNYKLPVTVCDISMEGFRTIQHIIHMLKLFPDQMWIIS
jgi:hypothetical protein